MSPTKTIALWLARLLASARSRDIDPESMELREWADLPAHHPCAALKP